jgi:hypothetical protein
MKCNVGKTDRILRIAAGLGLIGFALATGNVIGWVGIIPLATGIFRFCPAYVPLKISTDKK